MVFCGQNTSAVMQRLENKPLLSVWMRQLGGCRRGASIPDISVVKKSLFTLWDKLYPISTFTHHTYRIHISPCARLSFVQPGFLACPKTFFQNLLREFGSFDILTVIEAKGETITRFAEAKGGE